MRGFEDRPEVPAKDHQRGAPLVLRDPTLNRDLIEQGFVRLPGEFLNVTDRAEVRAYFDRNFAGERRGFHNDFFIDDAPYRESGSEFLDRMLCSVWQGVLSGFEPFLLTFISKFPDAESAFPEHRDWMYVDETKGERSYILYVAIDDGDETTGSVRVVPRSHLLPGPPCGTRSPWPWLRQPEILDRYSVALPLRAGEAAVWDNRTIHMSSPNLSDSARLSVAAWCHRPENALVHFVGCDSGEVEQYQVDRAFFNKWTPELLRERPLTEYSLIERLYVEPGRTDPHALTAHLEGRSVAEQSSAWTIRRKLPDGL